MSVRTGLGFDVHAFSAVQRPLVLGGVVFEGHRGLDGHSDADVVAHSIADALLGAAALGDIGTHFPDTDAAFAGISSLTLLERVAELIDAAGYEIVNVDATLLLETPKVAARVPEMRERLAAALRTDAGAIGVKATTAERLGAIGRGEGAACLAVATLRSRRPSSPS